MHPLYTVDLQNSVAVHQYSTPLTDNNFLNNTYIYHNDFTQQTFLVLHFFIHPSIHPAGLSQNPPQLRGRKKTHEAWCVSTSRWLGSFHCSRPSGNADVVTWRR